MRIPVIFMLALLTSACSTMQEWRQRLEDVLPGSTSAATQPDAVPQETARPAAAGTPTDGPASPATEPAPPPVEPVKPVAQVSPVLGAWCGKFTKAGAALQPGNKGDKVKALQELLTQAGFYRNEVDGKFDAPTGAAVIAFHKAHDQPRTATWRKSDWPQVCAYTAPSLPPRQGKPDRVEVDLDRQLLYLVKHNKVQAILPVSSGNGKPYQEEKGNWVKATTPLGDYAIARFYNGWRTSYLGELYRPWYFYNGYAVHGSPSVPSTPASHGCVRVTMWDADYLAGHLAIGMPLYIWTKNQLAQAQ